MSERLSEWLVIILYLFGIAQGFFWGWYLWRLPALRYRSNERLSASARTPRKPNGEKHMARSDKTHEQRIADLEVELANLNIFLDHWMSRPVLRVDKPRTFWQRLNDYFSR